MLKDITRLSDDGYRTRISSFMTSAKALANEAAELVVQAILHYLEHNRDISRCKTLMEAMLDTGQGRLGTAFSQVLRKTTAQTGIGTENWKGGKVDAELPEGYEAVLNEIAENGGPILLSYAKAPGQKSKEAKAGAKKTPTLKLPEDTPEPVVNEIQKFLDGKTSVEATAVLTQMVKGGVRFKNPDVQTKYEELVRLAGEIEKQAGICTRTVKTAEGDIQVKENSNDKLLRLFSSSVNFARTHLEDFKQLMSSVKDQAKDQAEKIAEAA